MPIPSKKKGEDKNKFMSRCMGDSGMNKEFPDSKQRVAVCMSKATEDMNYIEAADFKIYFDTHGSEEEVDQENLYIPAENEYVTAEECGFDEEDVVEWDAAKEGHGLMGNMSNKNRPGLWENIKKKKERLGKNYKPAKPGEKDRPDPKSFKEAQGKFKYKDPKTGEYYYYERQGVYKKDGRSLVLIKSKSDVTEYMFDSKEEAMKLAHILNFDGVFSHTTPEGKTYWMPGKDFEELDEWCETQEEIEEAMMEQSEAKQITRKSMNNLPDSDFAYIEPGGSKDSEGKTVPRSLRHLPIHDAAHVRNALARLPLTDISDTAKQSALRKIKQAAKKFNIDVGSTQQKSEAKLIDWIFVDREDAMRVAQHVGLHGIFRHIGSDGREYWIPGQTQDEFMFWLEIQEEIDKNPPIVSKMNPDELAGKDVHITHPVHEYLAPQQLENDIIQVNTNTSAAEKSSKVKLNKPFRTPSGPKKFSVYVKNDKGNVVKVNFGDPNMDIKRDDPERRKSFRARHHCDTDPGPKWKSRYWSCRQWRANAPVED